MKRLILISVFILVCLCNYGQARIGNSYSELREEYAEYKPTIDFINEEKVKCVLSVKMDNMEVLHGFDIKQRCIITIITPNKMSMVNWYVEYYNNNYTIISNKKWKAYLNNGICNIQLTIKEGLKPYFMWTEDE